MSCLGKGSQAPDSPARYRSKAEAPDMRRASRD